jgi:Asp-tRNA(Asn)/Glu-tRNA(Gln) amidotransferase A subunit family amidase
MLPLSRTLDHVGLFARTLDDVALLAEALVGHDEHDPDTRPRAPVPFRRVAGEEPPLAPMFALVKTPHWDRAAEDTRAGFTELVERLGDRVEEVDLLPSAVDAWAWHRTIMEAEMAANLEREWEHGREALSPAMRAQLERGREVRAVDYQRALARSRPLPESFRELFEQRYDAILTPAAAGTAPADLTTTGDPAFCALWTLCGMPALSVPLMQGDDGLPLGIQLVGPRDGDARLLRTARWLVARLAAG